MRLRGMVATALGKFNQMAKSQIATNQHTPSASPPKQQPSGLTKLFPKSLKLIGMSKQTAVDFLWIFIMENPFAKFDDAMNAYSKAKELEKQQIFNAYHSGIMQCDEADLYYKEMYGGKDE